MAAYRLACDTCEVMAGPGINLAVSLPAPGTADWLAEHDGHVLSLVGPTAVGSHLPRPYWVPRPLLGPPLPGEAQDVVCPVCQAFGGSVPHPLAPIWKRTTAGEPFLFCRSCAFTWGPGAEAERSRMMLRSQGKRRR